MIFTIIFIVHLPHLPPGFTTMTIKNYIYVTHLELSYTKYKYNIYNMYVRVHIHLFLPKLIEKNNVFYFESKVSCIYSYLT